MALPPWLLGVPDAAVGVGANPPVPVESTPGGVTNTAPAPKLSLGGGFTTVDPNSQEGADIVARTKGMGTLDVPDATTDSSRDQGDALASEASLDSFFLRGAGAQAPQGVVQSGYRYGRVGEGKKGRDDFTEAFESSPEQINQALVNGANAAAAEGDEMAKVYKQSADDATARATVHRAQAIEDEQVIAQKQTELDSETTRYTNDLADQGKFWRNPGNIVAAIAYSLMPITSNDPGVGVKLINQAVQQDMANRKQVADMHLGELRSNLGGYRKMVADRQAGDTLAEAEAYRIVATDIQRISSSYQGQKAQAQAAAMSGHFQQQSNLLKMQVFNSLINQDPSLRPAALAKADAARAGNMMTTYDAKGNPVSAPAGEGQAPGAPGTAQGSAPSQSQAAAPSASGSGAYPGQSLLPGATVSRAAEQPKGGKVGAGTFEGVMGKDFSELADKRSPGSPHNIKILDDNLNLWARAETGHAPNPQDPVFMKAKARLLGDAKKEIKEVTMSHAKDAGRQAGYVAMQRDIAMLEKKFGGNQDRIVGFLGGIRQLAPQTDREWEEASQKLGLKTDEEKMMAMRIRQLVAKNVNAYFKDTSGGAISPTEETRLKAYISGDATWGAIKNFARDMSSESAKTMQAHFASMTPLARQYATIRMGQGLPLLDSPGK